MKKIFIKYALIGGLIGAIATYSFYTVAISCTNKHLLIWPYNTGNLADTNIHTVMPTMTFIGAVAGGVVGICIGKIITNYFNHRKCIKE